MRNLKLPTIFHERVINTFGKKGEMWLTQLPQLMTECAQRFNMTIGPRYAHQSFNVTAKAIQSEQKTVVIKLCMPSKDVENEANALAFMQGDGIVNLLEADTEKGILILEACQPGEMLTHVENDIDAMHIAADIMQKIWKPINKKHTFQTTKQWFGRLEEPIALPANFARSLVDKARQFAYELHQDSGDTVLLHGDLHHYNILSSGRQPWLAIDPKGVIGEREYEIGALLRNPIPTIAHSPCIKNIFATRIDIFKERLQMDRQKIIAWSFAQAILATVWCVDSNTDQHINMFLACADALNNLK